MRQNDKIKNTPQGIYKKKPDLYQNHYLEQYKLYSKRLDMDIQRILTREKFFLTLNSAFLAGIIFAQGKLELEKVLFILILTFASLIDLVWFFTMNASNKLKKSQLFVLKQMEINLPARPFSFERENDEIPKTDKTTKQAITWKAKIKKLGLLRQSIPILFILLYFVYGILVIFFNLLQHPKN